MVSQPDASLVIVGGKTRINKKGYVTGPPELLVEVALSSAAYDLFEKKKDYERYGVGEYLVLNLDDMRAHWFTRAGGKPKGAFLELTVSADGILRSRIFPGLWLDVSRLVPLRCEAFNSGIDPWPCVPRARCFCGQTEKVTLPPRRIISPVPLILLLASCSVVDVRIPIDPGGEAAEWLFRLRI